MKNFTSPKRCQICNHQTSENTNLFFSLTTQDDLKLTETEKHYKYDETACLTRRACETKDNIPEEANYLRGPLFGRCLGNVFRTCRSGILHHSLFYCVGLKVAENMNYLTLRGTPTYILYILLEAVNQEHSLHACTVAQM